MTVADAIGETTRDMKIDWNTPADYWQGNGTEQQHSDTVPQGTICYGFRGSDGILRWLVANSHWVPNNTCSIFFDGAFRDVLLEDDIKVTKVLTSVGTEPQ